MIRWGILGCGRIAGHMADTIHALQGAELAAAASRDAERAKNFALRFHIPTYYDSYEKLAGDAAVDAVYVATVNTAHYDAVRTCLLAGKAVLCEKPMAITAAQAEELFVLAREKNVLLMEAMWTRFLPAWRELKTVLASGVIGEVKEYYADFSKNFPFDPESRIFNKEVGGGALLDLGVYGIHSAFHLLGIRYHSLYVTGRKLSTGVDGYAAMTLRYPDGLTAIVTCATDMAGPGSATVHGTGGWIEIPHFNSADRFIIHLENNATEPKDIRSFPFDDGFIYEVDEFQKLLSSGKKTSPVIPPEDTIAAQRIIESAMKMICDES